MTFVDTNVFMYAVGGEHPLKPKARTFFREALEGGRLLVTSSEVLQELLHAYLPVDRLETLDAALALVDGTVGIIWSVEADDVRLARVLVGEYPALRARDLVHLACCRRRDVALIETYDRGLSAALDG